jgi:peptidoglycan biosynthesis protein MviN/MurJ (putative lipid II flippase)
LVPQDVVLISTISLTIELIVLGLLFFSYYLKRRKMYRRHGITNTTAVGLHLVTIFSWMIWSFRATFPIELGSILHITTLAHVAFGIIAAALGIWLVVSWHLRTDVQKMLFQETNNAHCDNRVDR